MSPEGDYLARRDLIVEVAAKFRIPAMYPYRDFVELCGLMSYAPDLGQLAQHMAEDVHKILGGVAPGDVPFYQPDKFELLIKVKTARALDLDLPQTLLDRADELIE